MRYGSSIEALEESLNKVEQRKVLDLEVCKAQEVETKRRLNMQMSSSDKRLKELVFEVIGKVFFFFYYEKILLPPDLISHHYNVSHHYVSHRPL